MADLAKRNPQATDASGTRPRALHAGMAATLLCLLAGLFYGEVGWLYSAATVLAVNMVCPRAFAPATALWLGLCSLAIQGIALFLLTPVDLLRRALGKGAWDIAAIKARMELFVGASPGGKPRQDVKTPL